MNSIKLNCRRFRSREAAHAYIKRRLRLPEYYGKNLDALHDVLTELADTEIILRHSEKLADMPEGYGERFKRVFLEACSENSGLFVKFE